MTTTPDPAAVRKVLADTLDMLGDGFHRSAGSDQTSWDECRECYRADWQGHQKNCRMARVIRELNELMELFQ